MTPARPNPINIEIDRMVPRPKNFPKRISFRVVGNESNEFIDPDSISPIIEEYPRINAIIDIRY